MKVLMCAYACWPGLGSEPGVGWACAGAHEHEVWVLTHSANATAIDAVLEEDDSLAGLHPVSLQARGLSPRRGPRSAERLPALINVAYQRAAGCGMVCEVTP
jgi:hypothetical protein